MKATTSELIPAPPGLLPSLIAGFDAVTTHIALILFPFGLDLILWLGPHLKLTQLIERFAAQMFSFPGLDSPDTAQVMQFNRDIWEYVAQHLNLAAALRSYPVGIPSLMASRLPIETPQGLQAINIVVSSFGAALAWGVLFSFIGLIVGTLYFQLVASSVIPPLMKHFSPIKAWPKTAIQVILLTVVWGLIFIAFSLPGICIISALILGSPALGQIAILLFGGIMIWLLFPLLFSPHGIFIYQDNVLMSLRKGVRVTRMTLPTTGLLFLIIIVASQGLDLLWSSPAENSWLTLVGIIGHAFVTTGLLAASFVYYWKTDQWIQAVLASLPESLPGKMQV